MNMTVHFMYQLNRAKGFPNGWKNIISGVTVMLGCFWKR